MFFEKGRLELFPKEIRKSIENLYLLDKLIYKYNKENKDINLLVIDYIYFSIALFLKYYKKLNPLLNKYFEEALGEIPIMFFLIDNLNVNKKIKDNVKELIDISNSRALKKIDRIHLVKKVYKNLEKIKPEFVYDKGINKKEITLIINQIKKDLKE